MTCKCHESVAELNTELSRFTSEVSQLRGLALNDVLLSASFQIPAAGMVDFHTQVPYAMVSVLRLGANALTVQNSAPEGAAPLQGRGVLPIPVTVAGVTEWPMVGTHITVYGTVGDIFAIALLSRGATEKHTSSG